MTAERQVGERLSEQAREIAESWLANGAMRGNDPDKSNYITLARAYLSLARQLAEAERENGRLREALERIARTGGASRACRTIVRAALNPPDPPASPAEGGNTKGSGIT